MRRWFLYLVVTALAGVAIIARGHLPGLTGKNLSPPVSAISSLQPGP